MYNLFEKGFPFFFLLESLVFSVKSRDFHLGELSEK